MVMFEKSSHMEGSDRKQPSPRKRGDRRHARRPGRHGYFQRNEYRGEQLSNKQVRQENKAPYPEDFKQGINPQLLMEEPFKDEQGNILGGPREEWNIRPYNLPEGVSVIYTEGTGPNEQIVSIRGTPEEQLQNPNENTSTQEKIPDNGITPDEEKYMTQRAQAQLGRPRGGKPGTRGPITGTRLVNAPGV